MYPVTKDSSTRGRASPVHKDLENKRDLALQGKESVVSSGTFGSSQGVVGTRQEFSETIPVFLDTIQSEDGIGSRPGFTSISSQTFSKQPSQRPDSQEHTTFSSESSYRNSQQNIRNNQQQRFTISQQDYRSLPHESFTRNQQDSNKFSQTISSLQQQPGRIQPSNSFQTSSRNVQVNINTQYNNQQFQHSGESFISSNEKEISGVFEPLNLPSGATRLMGEISTSFTCIDQPYGYYADLQNSCRVFHVCYPALFSTDRIETYQYSFMCGEGTQFDQKEMTCVKESDAIPCANSQEYFFRNGEFGLPEERAKF
ncbi:hypothetical protein SK128_002614 [Halocaridina rubra]|uniref:Chitin-binding type-2 domain-containing protein n=1 Tax=Halocaridina rubra TaxID=373956 RepID=A0AAN8X134_HALRR